MKSQLTTRFDTAKSMSVFERESLVVCSFTMISMFMHYKAL